MNDFYTAGTGNFNAFTTARAEDIVNEISSIEAGFDKLPAELALNQDRVTYLAAGGTANALTATLSPVPSAYVDGMTLNVKIASNNTGAATLNVNALGAISIVDENGANITADALTAGHVHRMVYVAGKFRLLNNSAKVAAAAASATAAAASASAAATSEANAATSETNAGTSETNAAASASAASSSATSASGSASAASASASAASTSETNAGTSETNASSSASAAATSAAAASTSEINAAASAASAVASYDSFDDRYLGAKASDPTLDNDGNALLEGAVYWNTTSKVFRAWDGSAWDGSLGPYLPLAGGTLTGALALPAGATGGPSMSIPHGAAPTAPTSGDLWSTTAGFFARINGVTEQFATVDYVDNVDTGPTYSAATADQTTTSATAIDITNLAFTPAANTSYEVEALLLVKLSNGTNNFRIGVVWPTGLTLGQMLVEQGGNLNLNDTAFATNNNGQVEITNAGTYLSDGFAPGNAVFRLLRIKGLVVAGASPSGSFKLQYASNGSLTATVGKGSLLKYRVL